MPSGGRRRRAFTLVELLVVVGIIALLIALLMPALQKSRYEAQVTACSARLQQFVAALGVYANENKGKLPRYDLNFVDAAVYGNLWDVSPEFYDTFRTRYALPHEAMFCPLSREEFVGGGWRQTWRDGVYRIGYAVWVPRRHGVAVIPPAPDDGQSIMYTLETTAFCGPQRQGDGVANHNPVVTDLLMSKWWERVLPCADASKAKTEDLTPESQHVYRDKVHSFNAGFADGHVERMRPDEVRPRFMSAGSNWVWR